MHKGMMWHGHPFSALRVNTTIAVVAMLLAALMLSGISLLASTHALAASLDAPREQPADDTSEQGRVSLTPSRFDTAEVDGGDELRYTLTVRNTTDGAVDVSALAVPLGGTDQTTSFAAPIPPGSTRASAATWVTFPGFSKPRSLPPGRELLVPSIVRIPRNASPGTYAIALVISQQISALGTPSSESPGSRVRLGADLGSVATIRVSGDAKSEARIMSTKSPRWITGGSPAKFTARVKNTGDTDLVLDAQVELSPFLGVSGRAIGTKKQPTLPDGERTMTMSWNDSPLIGRFRPSLTVVGGAGSGVRLTQTLPTVWVIPPWWLMLLIALAIALPVWLTIRRRRDPDRRTLRSARARARVQKQIRTDAAKSRAAQARRNKRQ